MQDLRLSLRAVPGAESVELETSQNEARLRRMVDDYFAFVWRSLCHLGVPEADAEDAAQQVFLVASRKLDGIVPGSERAFLFGTSVRIASRARRSRMRRREIAVPQHDDSPDAAPGPDDLVDRARARTLLEEALQAMDPDVRSVFILFEIEQLSKSQVAAALDIPAGTVASRVRRARDEFRTHVRRFEARAKYRGGLT